MKTRAKFLFLSTSLLAILMLAGCNKPQDATSTTKADTKLSSEIKDSEITVKVKTTLLLDEAVKGLDITVVTTNGDVRITGVVDTQAQFDQVDKIVRGIAGVHSVHDELTIKK
jgi:osmotically-inducible protein OsmY